MYQCTYLAIWSAGAAQPSGIVFVRGKKVHCESVSSINDDVGKDNCMLRGEATRGRPPGYRLNMLRFRMKQACPGRGHSCDPGRLRHRPVSSRGPHGAFRHLDQFPSPEAKGSLDLPSPMRSDQTRQSSDHTAGHAPAVRAGLGCCSLAPTCDDEQTMNHIFGPYLPTR